MSVTVLTVVDTTVAVVLLTVATEVVASLVTLFFLCPRPLVSWLLAFSWNSCFLAFSSAYLALSSFLCFKASSLFCFFSALFFLPFLLF